MSDYNNAPPQADNHVQQLSATNNSGGFLLGFWTFFLENRAFTYFVTFLVIVSGIYSIIAIPKENTPEITLPIAVVSTSFFGASADDVESLVTDPIEERISNISGVKDYTSSSQSGFSSIIVNFEQGEDIDEKVADVKEQIDQVKSSLPSDGNDPSVRKIEFSAQPIFTVSLVSELPFYTFEQVVKDLESELLNMSQVAEVSVAGIPEREISVIIDNRKLESAGLDYNTVVRQLGGSKVTLPGGSLDINGVEYPLDIKADVSSYNELQAIPIAASGNASVVITDVAKLYNGYREANTVTQVGFPGGETLNAVTLNISKKNGGDITRLTADIVELLENSKETTLLGVDYVVTLDAGEDIKQSLGELTASGLQTVLLVFIILFFVIGFRESVIAAVSIPLSFLLAFVAFLVTGNTINFISLFALILSIGILVDSAIVVVEGINQKISEGMRRQDAAVETVKEYGIPLFAGTMTTIAVFFPLLFLSGIIGQFIKGIPFTVIFVLLASIFVALGLLTVFCASILKNRDVVKKETAIDRMFGRIQIRYKQAITNMLRNAVTRRMFQSVIAMSVIGSVMLVSLGLVKVEFFPGGDLEIAFIEIELDQGASLQDTRAFTETVNELLQDKEYLESYVTTLGRQSQFTDGAESGDQYANITLNIAYESQSEGVALLDGLREQIEQGPYQFAELNANSGGPPTGAAIDVTFTSDDTELLRDTVRQAENVLSELDGTLNVATTLAANNSGFDVVVDRNAVYRYGVSINDIAQAIRGATDGTEIFEITENGEDIPVFVRNKLNYQSEETIITKDITPDQLLALQIRNNRGEYILLGNVIDITLAEADVEIQRKDGERVIGVTSDVDEQFNNAEVRASFEEKLQEIMPTGVSYSFGGEQQEQEQSNAELGIAFLAGVFLMFSILILQFGKWRQVVIILSVLPYALAGVILGLFVSGNALSFPAFLGLIALAGIVVNNSIILVSVFNSLRRQYPDKTVEEIVIEGAAIRLRPILLTTVTTIIGVSPLLTQSAIWSPIAYAIIFGLLFCSVITLFAVPILYRRLEGFRTGPWASVGGWWINLLLMFVLPAALLIAAAIIGSRVGATVQVALYSSVVIALGVAYVFSHIRKHKD